MTQSVPGLRRLELTVLKDKSSTDTTQVPASATVTIYRQGAVSKTTVTLPPNATPLDAIEVFDVGAMRKGDVLGIFRNGSFQPGSLTVDIVHNFHSFDATNRSSQTVHLQASDRLIPTNALPQLYSLRNGLPSQTIANPFSTDAGTGRAGAYVLEQRFDYIVSILGAPLRLYPDATGERVISPTAFINARDYANLQDAVNAVPFAGGVVFVPAGNYSPATRPAFTPPIAFPSDRPIHLLGAGPGATELEYLFRGLYPTDSDRDMIQVTGDHQTIEGFYLHTGVVIGGDNTGVGIRVWRSSGAGNIVYNTTIRNCKIEGTQSWGIFVDDATRDGAPQVSVQAVYDNIEIYASQTTGCVSIGRGSFAQVFKNCNLKNAPGAAVFAVGASGIFLVGCVFEGNYPPDVTLQDCSLVTIRDCWFENEVQLGENLLNASGDYSGLSVDGCMFQQKFQANVPNGGNDLAAVGLSGSGRGVVVSGCLIRLSTGRFANGSQSGQIVIDAPSGGSASLEVTVVSCVATDADGVRPLQVTDGSSHTVLVNAASRIRLPRLSSADIGSLDAPTPGDLLFDSTASKVAIYDGAAWRTIP